MRLQTDHIFNNHKGKRTINVKVSGKRYERVDGGKFMDTRVYKNVVVIPVEEVCVIECTGGASSSIHHGYCAMIGGVSIIKLAKDSVFVGRDGIDINNTLIYYILNFLLFSKKHIYCTQ